MPESNAMLKYVSGGIDTSTGGKIFVTKNSVLAGMEDTRTGALTNIDYAHHEIHEGNHYVAVVNENATNSTDFINVFFLGQGSTKAKRHMVIDVSADQAGAVYFYEDILTSGAGGTTYTALNNDRGSTNASDHKIEIQGTTHSSSTGTLLWAQTFGANAAAVRIGGTANQREEFILESSLDYELRYDPAANNANIFINASWYEE